MTTTRDQQARFTNAIAAAMCVLRPEWDVPGCVAALRKVPDVPLSQLGIAAMKYATDPGNLTPEWLSRLDNRAWDSDTYPPCTSHPLNRARRANGQCAACWADAQERPAAPMDRGGVPPSPEARASMLAAITRHSEREPRERAPLPPDPARSAARAEVEEMAK